jgi:C1A family cysteine protease
VQRVLRVLRGRFGPMEEDMAARSKKGGGVPMRRRICNVVPSRNTERDWQFGVALKSTAVAAVKKLPASVDLRAAWWTIGDQEDTGSCVGWASTDGVMRFHMVGAGRLAPKDRLSPRATWMASKEIDEFVDRPESFIEGAGTSLKAAMDVCRKYGTVPEAMLPFHIATKMHLGDEETFFATAAQRKAAAYFNLKKDFAQWRTWLASHGPLLVALNVDANWENATATKGRLDAWDAASARGGHAVCVVGYTSDKRFIIRNSWGTGWGDKGFAYASDAYVKAAFFDESYRIPV